METTNKTTPKDFFVTLGALVTLYIVIVSFLSLVFGIINHYLSDTISYYGDTLGTIRWTVSSLIILFPLFVYLSHLINKDIVVNPAKKNLWIKKWSTYLTLFLTGATVATDLVVLINTFLGGEITLRFILKVVAVLITALFVFSYYLYERKAKLYASIASVLVVASVVAGFISVGSPFDERARKFDDQRVSDLSSIQYQIVNFYQKKGSLPETLADINDPLSSFMVPVDPVTKLSYEYKQLNQTSFEICATFSLPSRNVQDGRTKIMVQEDKFQTFTHDSGRTCFSRNIDTQLYPIVKK